MLVQDQLLLIQRESFEIEIHFKGEVLIFDATSFGRTAYRNTIFPLFAEINDYLKILSNDIQSRMFFIYKQLHEALAQRVNAENHIVSVRPLVKELYDCFNFQHLINWTRTSANVVFPSNMAEHFVEAQHAPNQLVEDFDDNEDDDTEDVIKPIRQTTQAGTRDKTYIKRDYEELVALTIAMRLMVPIWGEFISKHSIETGTTFKEYYAGRLIEGSQIEQSEPFDKLRVYITEIIYDKDSKNNISGILDMLSSEDYPTWTLYIAMIRKLAIGDIRGVAQTESGKVSHLVASIHQYIRDRIVKHSNNFGMGNIRDKNIDKDTRPDEESRLTVFEIVKHSMAYSPGEEKEIELFASNTDLIIKDLCPDLPRKLLDESLESINVLESERIHFPQQVLASTMLGPYLSTSALLFLDKVQVINLLGIFQAMLWYRGHRELACVISSSEMKRSLDMVVTIGAGSRSHIPRALSDKLIELYPHRKNTGKINVQKRETLIHDLIKDVASKLFESDWKLNIPESWRSELKQDLWNPRKNQFIVPFDIRTYLAKFAIIVALNKFPLRSDAIIPQFE